GGYVYAGLAEGHVGKQGFDVVSERNVLQFDVVAIFDIDIRNVLVVGMAAIGEAGEEVGCSFAVPPAEYFGGVILQGAVGERPVGLGDLVSESSGSGNGQVDAFITEVDVHAAGKIGVWVADHHFVVVGNSTIVVGIHKDDIAGLRR